MELRRKGSTHSQVQTNFPLLFTMETKRGIWCKFSVLCLSLFITEGVMSSELANQSCTSRCGNITNISYPFRVQHDPPHCGNHSYELSCENNIPLLKIHNRKYRVLGINHKNFTIRLVDVGIHKGNCSSFPLNSLSLSYFKSYAYPYFHHEDSINPYITSTPNRDRTSTRLFEQVGFLKCSDPVRDDPAYVDTAPCGGAHHVYAVVGDLPAHRFKPQCQLKLVTFVASDWKSLVPNGRIKSYHDIHTLLSYGFELSWLLRACAIRNCEIGADCVFNTEIESLQCLPDHLPCYSRLGFTYGHVSKCRLPEWRMLVEDYLFGIVEGLFKLVGKTASEDFSTDSHFNRSNIALPLGIVTGNFVVPIISTRFLFGIIFLIALLTCTFRKRHLSTYENIEDFIRLHNLLPIRYSYKDLKTITEGFKNKLGKGGFGTVYKGKLKSGIVVAVKMLDNTKANGQEFINEVATIGRIHHFNVVHLVGFCVEGTKRALIYEFMSNGSLEKYIFPKDENISLSYHKIHEISLGVAHGIAYLHHGCNMKILHFDIKPHNILLDDNFIPKISDFRMARFYSVDNSIVTLTAARGTIGYMAPELYYKNIGGVSHKADVYSFGMLLMEMASQISNLNRHVQHSSQLHFPSWIYDHFDKERIIQMEELAEEEKDLVKKMLIVALWCTQLKPSDRPSMSKVIEMLEADDVKSLEMPPKPFFYLNEEILVDDGSYSSEAISTISTHSGSICEGRSGEF